MPEKAQTARELFLRELRPYRMETLAADRPGTDASPTHNARAQWAHGVLNSRRRRTRAPPTQLSLETEVERYLSDQLAPPDSSSLSWWQENSDRYPTIFRLAMDIIPIQGSAVPCERVFSSAKRP
ncbi:hypothetical protein QCA50_004634 [Cerrena zonata]|uniref:HAT C-terminal dimerisation domain-containing protein n=1 Tax=Cerrena zonata TaxID=2478898 RepID=A0AAW0GK05_9APHY